MREQNTSPNKRKQITLCRPGNLITYLPFRCESVNACLCHDRETYAIIVQAATNKRIRAEAPRDSITDGGDFYSGKRRVKRDSSATQTDDPEIKLEPAE